MHRVFNQKIKQVSVLTGLLALSACQNYSIEKPHTRVYVPQYIDFTYKIDGKVQVKHSYLFGAGVKPCSYAGELAKSYMEDGEALYPYKSAEMRNFFEKKCHLYQGRANRDNVVLGYSNVSRLSGDKDPETGKLKIFVTELRSFDPLCHGWVAGFGYSLKLKKSSSLMIAQDIAQIKKLYSGAWKDYVRWEPERTVQRGNNKWIVFKNWNRAIYLADATEDWYFPVANGAYYYHLAFDYKSQMREQDPEQYAKGRAMFDRILDSFEVRNLTPEESAAIVNPEPIEPPPRKNTNVVRPR